MPFLSAMLQAPLFGYLFFYSVSCSPSFSPASPGSACYTAIRQDVVGEVKGVDEAGVRVACRGARSRGDRRSKIVFYPKCSGLRHDMSDLALETVEESRTLGEDIVLTGLH
jgi:hypothetical protein